jgi:hypothetical protein
MSDSVQGHSLELYFIEGRPDGMMTAKVFNWTGHVLMTPRTRITAALARKEASATGVYILLGEKEGEPRAYIGEGEDISERIRSHDAHKDWWTSAILITSAADNLNKAHVKYLESRLVEEAREAKRAALDNGTTPARASLSEADQANMEGFLRYLQMVLPALRVDLLLRQTRPQTPAGASEGASDIPRFRLIHRKGELEASAVLVGGEFIVEAGSGARLRWEGQTTETSSYARLHAYLKKTGVLAEQGGKCVFMQNYAFSSPSAAAAVVTGRSANGQREWRTADGALAYVEWEATQLSAISETTP